MSKDAEEKTYWVNSSESSENCPMIEGLAKSKLQPEEFVALMGNSTIGFVGDEKKGPHTRFTMNPYVFDNTYYQELLLGDQSKYFKNEYDYKLL